MTGQATAPPRRFRATWSPRLDLVVATLLLILVAMWMGHHVLVIVLSGHDTSPLTPWYVLSFLLFGGHLLLSFGNKPIQVTDTDSLSLAELRVWALVPAYNEDPAALRSCVLSLLTQSRPLAGIAVVDDGSSVDYSDVRDQIATRAEELGVELVWQRQSNRGKRRAQAAGVRRTPDADVYVTTDSDGLFDPQAVEELLKPMARPEVQSVAGIVMTANGQSSLLSRLMDLWYVANQVMDRSAMSTIRSVCVNSGAVAAYRAGVIRDNLPAYLNEEFFGVPIEYSDDSMLTLYAMLRGETVQQPSAFAFALMPETLSHHVRQYVRWMRGAFIRSWWRLRYLPIRSAIWWLSLARLASFLCYLTVVGVVSVALLTGRLDPTFLVWWAGVVLTFGYAHTMRALIIRREDVSRGWWVRTWLLTPLAVTWAQFVLRSLHLYGALTWWRVDWGTRAQVEVELSSVGRS